MTGSGYEFFMVSSAAFQLFPNFVFMVMEIIHGAFANQPHTRSHQMISVCYYSYLRK